jgi:hypothetical protein
MRWLRSSGFLFLAAGGALSLAAPLSFRTRELPWAAVGADYRVTIQTQLDGRCPQSDVWLSVTAGLLPRGLELQGDWLTGVPEELGTFRFRVRGANVCAAAEQDYVLQVTGRPILRVSPEKIVFDYRVCDAGPEPQSLLVSSTWPAVPYSISATEAWLRGEPEKGVTPYIGSALAADRVIVRVITKDLAPGIHEASLVFVTYESATTTVIPVRVRVLAGAP